MSVREAAVDPSLASQLEALPRGFYARPTARVARDLLGRFLIIEEPQQGPRIARIVETEAYVGTHDLASHSSHGHTARTAPMFEEPGHAYVYFIYGMHWCLNVVTEEVGQGCAVLLRAAEPVAGIDCRTDGPGRLCRAMGVDGRFNRADLTAAELRVTRGVPAPEAAIATSPRVGVGYAGLWADEPLRFFIRDSKHVSRAPGGSRTALASNRRRN